MSKFSKMLFLMSCFQDHESRLMVFFEWLRDDSILDLRFAIETRMYGVVIP